jgi:hypothetical protein
MDAKVVGGARYGRVAIISPRYASPPGLLRAGGAFSIFAILVFGHRDHR